MARHVPKHGSIRPLTWFMLLFYIVTFIMAAALAGLSGGPLAVYIGITALVVAYSTAVMHFLSWSMAPGAALFSILYAVINVIMGITGLFGVRPAAVSFFGRA